MGISWRSPYWAQSLLVLLVVAAVLMRSETVSKGENGPTLEAPTALPTVAASSTATAMPTPTIEFTAEPTAQPTLAPTPTAVTDPTATDEPVATERPVAPDTGQDASLIVEYGASGRREVALTFDAGEGAGYTIQILALLAEYELVASFGVTGEWVEQNPDLTRQIVNEGHQLINHTYDHRSYTGTSTGLEPLSDDEFRDQVMRTEAVIEEVTGGYSSKPYFRFPYGDYNQSALDSLGELGYAYTMWWSCDTEGWNGYSPDQILENCGPDNEKEGGEGAIILMHVADENDWAALEPLIQAYAAEDYDFVTLEQLIQP